MKRTPLIITVLTLLLVGGCSSRSTPTPPIDYSLDGEARLDPLPDRGPAVPAGDLEKASEDERKRFEQMQHNRLQKQQDEIDDLRRQKFQDGYYESRYPTGTR